MVQTAAAGCHQLTIGSAVDALPFLQACLRPLGQNQNCMNIGDTERQRSRCRQDGAATVFFARCPPVTTEEQVHKLFSQFGHVQEVNLYRRWQSAKTSKGCGFVRFSDPLAAAAAREALDNKYMFENSEAPMVVEWLDPTRLVNRQHTHGNLLQQCPRWNCAVLQIAGLNGSWPGVVHRRLQTHTS